MTSLRVSKLFLGPAALLVALVAGCSERPPAPLSPAVIDSFEAVPSRVAAGGATRLSWSVSGDVDRVDLLRGSETLVEGAALDGSYDVSEVPEGTTGFLLVAYGEDGVSTKASASVAGVTRPEVTSFTASRAQAPAGAAVVLSWKALLAEEAVVFANDQELARFDGARALTGQLTVRPQVDTAYRLEVSGLAGQAQASVSVKVNEAPAFSLSSVTPSEVLAGETVTVSWAVDRATALTIKDGARTLATVAGEEVAEGSRDFVVDASRTFTLVAEGAGGVEQVSLPVSVIVAPRVESFLASPSQLVVGDAVTLSWTVADAQSLSLRANDVEVELDDTSLPSGQVTLSPVETTVYSLKVTGVGGEHAAELTVVVYGTPIIEHFDAAPREAFLRRDPVLLSWRTSAASSVSVSTSTGEIVDLGHTQSSTGSVKVYPATDTTYVLTATGPGGSVDSLPVEVTVSEPVPLIRLSLLRDPINRGMTSELSWTIEDADSFELSASTDGETFTAIDVTGKHFQDAIPTTPDLSTTYRLSATNAFGESVEEVRQTVVNPPAFARFAVPGMPSATADQVYVTMDEPFLVEWEATDSDGVLLDPPKDFIADTDPFVTIAGREGTVDLAVPTSSSILTVEFPDSFHFPFFGKDYGSTYMSTNGYLCFGDECSNSSTDQEMPSTSKPNGVIAAFWDSLKSVTGKTRWMYRLEGLPPDRRMTIEWNAMDFSSTSEDGEELTFQVVLFENGLWEIRNQPRTVGTEVGKDVRWGTSAAIGVESPDASSALLVSYRSASGLCSVFKAASGTTPGSCTPVTRIRPRLMPATGSVAVTLTPPNFTNNVRTLYLRAYGPLGATKSRDITVNVNRKPTGVSLTASRSHVGAGQPVTFTWTGNMNPTMDYARLVLRDADGDLVPIPSPATISTSNVGGTFVFTPTKSTTYTFAVVTKSGYEAKSEPVTVVLGPPVLTGVTVTPDSGAMKDRYTISWTEMTGATSYRLIDPNGDVVEEMTPPSGGVRSETRTDLVLPGEYSLVASNSSGDSAPQKFTLDIDTEVKVIRFAADVEEQTTGKPVTLSWETFNGTNLKLFVNDVLEFETTNTLDIRGSAQAPVKHPVAMPASDATFRLEISGTNGSASSTVDVRAAPTPRVLSFVTEPSTVEWGKPFTLKWTTQNGTSVRVQEILQAGGQTAVVREFPLDPSQFVQGQATATIRARASFRLVVENRVGDQAVQDITRDPLRGSPTFTFDVSPEEGTPRQGYSLLSWNATQVDGVRLWEGGDNARNVPIEYVPYGFVDISGTGTPLTLKTTTDVETNRAGFATVAFPDAFRPPFFGEKMAAMLVSSRGIITLSPNAADPTMNGCASTTFADSLCSSAVTPGRYWDHDKNVATPQVPEPPHAFIAPFQGSLNGCGSVQSATNTCTGRVDGLPNVPGQVHWELLGQAPERVLIVQWTDWDFDSSTVRARLTFQAKLHENGDTEFQYKRMFSSDLARAGGNGGTIGVETPDGKAFLHLDEHASNDPVVFDGDGYRLYTGLQPLSRPASAPLRSRFIRPSSGTGSSEVIYRASVETSGVSSLPIEKGHPILNGDFFISELMIDTEAASDLGREWIEIRNGGTRGNLKGLTLTTASSLATPFTFTENLWVERNESVLVAQSASPFGIGNAVVSAVYGEGVRLNNLQDTVILRNKDVLVDRVDYDRTAGWTVPRGRSLMLDPRAASQRHNDTPSMWCPGRRAGEAQSIGSPGQANDACMRWVETPGGYDQTVDLETRLSEDPSHRVLTGYSTSLTNQAYDVPLGFEFPYFGKRYNTVNITSLGAVAFGQFASSTSSMSTPSSTTGFPTPLTMGGEDLIAPFFGRKSSLRSTTVPRPTAVYVLTDGEAPTRRFIVHWASYADGGTAFPVDFSMVLEEQGGIEFHYKQLVVNTSTSFGAPVGLQSFGYDLGITAFKGPPTSTNSVDTDLTRFPAVGSSVKLVRYE